MTLPFPSSRAENQRDTATGGSLPRRLGLLSAIAVLVGSTIGSGIFRVPASIATRVPDEKLFLVAWVVGGFFTLCGALTYAELSAAFPRTGGVFVYLREGFGRLPAFLFGWSELTIVRASALGAISTVFAEYLLRLCGQPVTFEIMTGSGPAVVSTPEVHYVAVAAVWIVAVFNLVGVRLTALIMNLTTAAKYAALLLLVAAAFVIRIPATDPAVAAPLSGSTNTSLFGLALISILWAYDGWADVTFVSGEVRKPERNLPIALITGTGLVIVIYLLTNISYLHVLGLDAIAGSKLVAADSALRLVGEVGVTLVSLAVMISAFGTLNGSMLTGPRIFFAMADEGLFFKKIASVHPRFKTPYVAIGLATVLATIFVMVQSFEQLADTFILGIWPFYAGGVAAIYTLRRRRPDIVRPYRVIGYPITPALFLLAALFLIGNALVTDLINTASLLSGETASPGTGGTLLVFGVIGLGVPAYLIWNALQKRERAKG